jgi:hypothetical protein
MGVERDSRGGGYDTGIVRKKVCQVIVGSQSRNQVLRQRDPARKTLNVEEERRI